MLFDIFFKNVRTITRCIYYAVHSKMVSLIKIFILIYACSCIDFSFERMIYSYKTLLYCGQFSCWLLEFAVEDLKIYTDFQANQYLSNSTQFVMFWMILRQISAQIQKIYL